MAHPKLPKTVAELVNLLTDKHQASGFPNFIQYVRFPHYRNFADGTRLDFGFPVTALVGPNGSGKTSLLHALYGCPGSYNIGNFWFSTDLDPIVEGAGKPNCIIYGYHPPKLGKTIEVLKTRITKEDNPNYWEPSRPIRSYGMSMLSKEIKESEKEYRTLTRWKTLEKEVFYLDFRRTISAFDRFFWLGGPLDSTSLAERKAKIRRTSPHIVDAIEKKLTTVEYYRTERIKTNRSLTQTELKAAGFILGREYSDGDFIEHTFYRESGPSLRLVKADAKYSDAFAGSGETAVFITVIKVLAAPLGSLILLDEPEVSLHPGAQERLLRFLMDHAHRFGHQIVFTTHSPAMIKDLPPEAIRIVHEAVGGKSAISSSGSVAAAFGALEHTPTGEISVMVEDPLSAEILNAGFRTFHIIPKGHGAPKVRVIPGGSGSAVTHIFPAHFQSGSAPYLILDGDMFKGAELPSPSKLKEMNAEQLKLAQSEFVGATANLAANGGNDPNAAEARLEQTRNYLIHCQSRLGFLPGRAPEELLWTSLHPTDVGLQSDDYKSKFTAVAKSRLGKAKNEEITGAEILVVQKMLLTEAISLEPPPQWWEEVKLLCKAIVDHQDLRPTLNFHSDEKGTHISDL